MDQKRPDSPLGCVRLTAGPDRLGDEPAKLNLILESLQQNPARTLFPRYCPILGQGALASLLHRQGCRLIPALITYLIRLWARRALRWLGSSPGEFLSVSSNR